jgi:hypothetical protein
MEVEPALGSAPDVYSFVTNAVQRFGGELRTTKRTGVFELYPGDLSTRMVAQDTRLSFPLKVAFDGVPPVGVLLLGRNHPIVTTLTNAVLAKALSGDDDKFARCGAIYTKDVPVRTAILVLRLRYLLEEGAAQQFAEEVVVAAFRRHGETIEWVAPIQDEGLRLLREAQPSANIDRVERERQVEWALGMLKADWHEKIVSERVKVIKGGHQRLRSVVKSKPLKITPHEPPDILGCYVLVPAGGSR